MKKKTKNSIFTVIFFLIFITVFWTAKYFGLISSRFGSYTGFSEHRGMHSWELELDANKGTFKKAIIPEGGFLEITSETEEGVLSVSVKSGRTVIYELSNVGTGTFAIPVTGRVIVTVKVEDFKGNVRASSDVKPAEAAGEIYLFGEEHSNERILGEELEYWKEYYDAGMRDLFIELPFYDAFFLNEWMKADDDELLDALFAEMEGTAACSPQEYDFYKSIKAECPETIFHGTDVGHQYDTSGARCLEYLLANGYSETSEEYLRTLETIEQGKTYYSGNNHIFRENMLFANFVREYESLGGREVMGIYGSAHTDLNGLDYMTATVPCMGNDLKEYYGDAVRSTDLTLVTEPVDTVTVTINGKEYTAVSYGVQDLSGVFDGYESRECWRIEDAYDDFKDIKTLDNVLPYDNYLMNVETGQVFMIVYNMADGSKRVEYHRADGDTWNGKPVTFQMDISVGD
jgi:hypothetical protein